MVCLPQESRLIPEGLNLPDDIANLSEEERDISFISVRFFLRLKCRENLLKSRDTREDVTVCVQDERDNAQ